MQIEIVLSEKNLASFWEKVDKRSHFECWPWRGYKDSAGYGRLRIGRDLKYIAPRVSWFIANGSQPDGFVCHSCDNPICVNPAHLWIGDVKSNTLDMISKGRGRNQKKTHCKSGHELSGDNCYVHRGRRSCRACNAASSRKYAQKRLAKLGDDVDVPEGLV